MAAKDLTDKQLEAALKKLGEERHTSDARYAKEMNVLRAEQNRRAAISSDGKGP